VFPSHDPVALQEELEAEVASYKQKPNTKLKDFMKKSGKFAIVRRKEDGVVLDIPVEHLEETLSKGFELITDDAGTPEERDEPIKDVVEEVPEPPKEEKAENVCDDCEREFKSAAGLKRHVSTKHA